MNSFNFNRFCKTLRWVVGVNIRNLMMWTIGYTLALFMAEQISFAFSSGKEVAAVLADISQFCSIFIMIGLAVGFSTLFVDLNKKPRREAFLMLPASNLEKYLSAVVYVTIVWTFFVMLSFVVGDTTRMVYRALVDGEEWLSCVPLVLDTFKPASMDSLSSSTLEYMVMYPVVICALIVWIHSLYIFGGTLFRKYSFVFSTIILILTMWLLGWLTGHYHLQMFSSNWENDHYTYQKVGLLAYVLAVVFPLLSVFNYWASFHIFKGFQLITNKWTNYDFHK